MHLLVRGNLYYQVNSHTLYQDMIYTSIVPVSALHISCLWQHSFNLDYLINGVSCDVCPKTLVYNSNVTTDMCVCAMDRLTRYMYHYH